MRAIILAAGFGRRLQPITNTIPKSMVPVKEVPLIVRSMRKIQKLGVSEFVIVTGHMADYIREQLSDNFNGTPITYIENTIYETTNNIYSLWMAAKDSAEDVCLFECDLLYSDLLLDDMCKSDSDCAIVTSFFNEDTMDGSVIEIANEDKAVNLVLKKEQGSDFDYTNFRKTVNIYKFKKDFWNDALVPALDKEVKSGNVNSYYELVLKEIMRSNKWDMKVVNVPESYWCEIDDIDDLRRAEGSNLL